MHGSGNRLRRALRLRRQVAAPALLAVVAVVATAIPAVATARPRARVAERPAHLVQAGDSKTNCVYVGGGSVEPQLSAAERVTGATWTCLETFSDADPYWSRWIDPWLTHANSGVPEWIARGGGTRTLIVSEDLIPQSITNDPDPLTWEVPCDQGAFDVYAKEFANALVRAGEGYSVIRLGKEMNGGWEQDYMGRTPSEQHDWARCFANEVTAMRSVRGAHFLFDWNPNTCTNNYPLADFYPGNAYVDIIGADIYDADCTGPLPPPSPASWHKLYSEVLGLGAITRFAVRHHKPMSIPEWGLVNGPTGNGDDAFYVKGIASYVAHHDVAFQSYFDLPGNGILGLGLDAPNALQAYRRAIG